MIDVDAHRLSICHLQHIAIEFKLETDKVALPDSKLLAGEGGGGLGRGSPSVELEMDNGASNQNDIFLQESSVCIYVHAYTYVFKQRHCRSLLLKARFVDAGCHVIACSQL